MTKQLGPRSPAAYGRGMGAVIVSPRADCWEVRSEDDGHPVSVHDDATSALLAAVAHATDVGGADVLLRDRHHHVHVARRVPPADAARG